VSVVEPIPAPKPRRAPSPRPGFSSLRRVVAPASARVATRSVALGLAALLLVAAVSPWQQTAPGAGRVIAWHPHDREQDLEAPIKGRLVHWFAAEGQRVAAGEPLVEIQDNDPDYLSRLQQERGLTQDQVTAAETSVVAYEAKLTAITQAMDSATRSAQAKVEGAEEKVIAEEGAVAAEDATWRTAVYQLDRVKALHAEGIRSTRDLELAQVSVDTSKAKLEQARAKLQVARAEVVQARQDLDKTMREYAGKVAETESELQVALDKAAGVRAKLVKVDVDLARQQTQLVRAPFDAVVARVYRGRGGDQVKEGEPLAHLVPATSERAVEIWLDGNDAPLVSTEDVVSVQLEGWPALQVPGWPFAAVGTFPGRVGFVDPIDDGKGSFRVVVFPAEEGAWPEAERLRQGNLAKGWVMLSRVPLAWELWRLANDFPPAAARPAKRTTGDKDDKGGGEADGGKNASALGPFKAGEAWKPK
jgi:adhesin transport system membrane fusion protein